MADSKRSELDQLRQENAHLIGLLEAHGIAWSAGGPARAEPSPISVRPSANGSLSPQEKVALFRHLFRGRGDVYALRWQSTSSGRSGYAPACANGWRQGICEKPRVACRDCQHRELLPLSDAAIYGHLAGDHTIGLYPLLENDHCHLLAVDFEEQDWRDDARGFLRSCRELAVPAALEISRSGEGAHVWVFFEEAVSAREARQLELISYDRLFPNQDTLPKGGFGNLIALPLQKEARQRGCSVFVDDNLQPYPDQWAYLATLQHLSLAGLQSVIQGASGGGHPLVLAFIDAEDLADPMADTSAGAKDQRAAASDAQPHPGRAAVCGALGVAAAAAQSPDPPGGLCQSRLLQSPGHAPVGVGQAAGDRLRRKLPATHRLAARLPGASAGSAAGAGDRLGAGFRGPAAR